MEGQGVVAEVIIPEFGLPFEMHQPSECALKGHPLRTQVEIEVGNRAYNRWLADMISFAPNRFAAMAAVDFRDVEGAVRELRWCRDHGLSGVMMPMFDEEMPLFDARHDPIWSTLEELDMVVNCHIAISATSRSAWMVLPPFPHPGCSSGILFPLMEFYAHEVLGHLVWGGVLERHSRLKVVLTEEGSGWLIDYVAGMEHRYTNSFMRRDVREVVRRSPREYFEKQIYVGSTLLSRAEVERRHEIGIDKMMFGADYPHHEGTWRLGTQDYLRALFGHVNVPEDEARKILGENAAKFFGLDLASLQLLADEFGPSAASILTRPGPEIEEKFARGDLHKPVAALI
jgi:predicted TIM-barrel fold metal-dependent hydrolase